MVIDMSSLFGRDLITTQDWSIDELTLAIEPARKLKAIRRQGKKIPKILERKNFFMIFYARSIRTRWAFEVGMELLGGHAHCTLSEPEEIERQKDKCWHR